VPDIASLFELTVDPMELIVRGTLIYWFLFLLLRFVLRRDIGSVGLADVLLLVLIADAAQNAMAGGYESVTDGFILVGTIAGWNWLLDWAAFRFLSVRRLVEPRPLPLVRDGQMNRRNMRRQMITVDELMAKLREHGIEHLDDVKQANMESDGEISIVAGKHGKKSPESGKAKRKVAG
jgi:uncharacterized membrane protein YcaP (DUF421 family)